jgi:hypothetical protein
MSLPDPTRRLRGEISAAVRNARPELEAELRRELALTNAERALTRHLSGLRLTSLELRRLRLALEEHGPNGSTASRTPKPEPEPMAEVVA